MGDLNSIAIIFHITATVDVYSIFKTCVCKYGFLNVHAYVYVLVYTKEYAVTKKIIVKTIIFKIK